MVAPSSVYIIGGKKEMLNRKWTYCRNTRLLKYKHERRVRRTSANLVSSEGVIKQKVNIELGDVKNILKAAAIPLQKLVVRPPWMINKWAILSLALPVTFGHTSVVTRAPSAGIQFVMNSAP